ncbi:MAG: hypothetical protein QXX94_02375 [Candidatus Bathyarchaeia archaeon]
MKKAALSLSYILSAWILMVSYQMFTHVSVSTVVGSINGLMPSLSNWLLSKIDLINFIHNFAWIFVLSSLIPSILLGKERNVTVHFIFCLTFTLISTWIKDYVFELNAGGSSNLITTLSLLFHNLPVAIIYLYAPYIVMIALDIHTNKLRTRKKEEMIKSIEMSALNNNMKKVRRNSSAH